MSTLVTIERKKLDPNRLYGVIVFDGCGQLQDVEKAPYSRMTSLRFGDRYSTTHA